MKKVFFIMLAATFLFMIPLGASAGPVKLTVAEIHPKDYPTTEGLFKFAELVKQRSNGQIIIDVKFGGQLGKGEKKVVEQVQARKRSSNRYSLVLWTWPESVSLR
jgi:TRAP-type C4-dicarboxylate transport system substrate-binding protein